ncbi:hypothetical protein GH714_009210 [Hevea brasiliensis]|uniref:GRPD C-terminal domain-containing protein n=1 Tax=Hevea brasiliensis TaxID=3981 RepID=A0A6A6NGA5_HEVBR|nr:hypothetical protein GH714_009210 [Hevea brasiliensis]
MEKEQELEWVEAQKIAISEDLVAAAKQQLQFLAEVDRHRQLYEDTALDRAIYRYKYCWLPLLAKHAKSQLSEGPLVVPLDCEWIWHCHRLNPVRYKNDCKELYGRILGNQNVISKDSGNNVLGAQKSTTYDLVSAVKRQSSFYYQVCRSHMKNDVFLEEAAARYKGFLHLIKRNQERSIRQFCVPTYDIDLIWHSHQLCPVSYCNDMVAILGRVLEHGDTDSDRTKDKKLDIGSSLTAKQWEETFGSSLSNYALLCLFTSPVQAPFMLHLVKTHQQGKVWTRMVDEANNEIMRLQMSWRFQLQDELNNVGCIYELTGFRKVVILPGRKLKYENGSCEKHKSAESLMKAVEFSAEYPYGKAVALFNLKSGVRQINEEWLVVPGILLAFLLSNTLRKDCDCDLIANMDSPIEVDDASKQVVISKMECEIGWESIEEAIEVTEDSTSNRECGNGSEATTKAAQSVPAKLSHVIPIAMQELQ